jgi:hypothetical protein
MVIYVTVSCNLVNAGFESEESKVASLIVQSIFFTLRQNEEFRLDVTKKREEKKPEVGGK